MILSISQQSGLFVLTVAVGFGTGFLYDVFRILRKTFHHPDFLTQLEDLLYWLLVSGLVFYFLLNRNYGEIRFYAILGEFLGMGLYFLTLSRPVMFVSVTVVNFLKRVISVLISLILFPIKILLRLLMIPAHFVGNTAAKVKRPVKKVLQKTGRYAKMKTRKTMGDFRIIFKKV